MTRKELTEIIEELANHSDIFSPIIADNLIAAAAMLQRDGERIAALEAERDRLRAEPEKLSRNDLPGMCEAFDRVIEAYYSKTYPFHNPVAADARVALRVLRGICSTITALREGGVMAYPDGTIEDDDLRMMDREIQRLRAELANKDQILGDTLAVLCGDGGHYRAEHGDIKAKEHGLKRYHDLLVSEDGLRAELAEFKEDAERYRWLREKIENDDFLIARVSDWGFTSWCGDDPDRYIDAALAAREE